MFESLVGYVLLEHQYGATFVPPEGPTGYARALSKQRRPHATSDGYICMLPYTDRPWRRFWELVGPPERAADPRFVPLAHPQIGSASWRARGGTSWLARGG